MADYPPRITVTCTIPGSESLMLRVEGIGENCTFNMLPSMYECMYVCMHVICMYICRLYICMYVITVVSC